MFPQIFGKYVLEREIAAGGMARVFLATLRGAVGFEKRLVVKQIRSELAVDEAFVRRFVEEAKTAVELSHPNIVPVYELGVEQGVYYIAMEHCPGVTLADVLAYTGTLAPDEGAYVGAEVCRALDYAHRRAGIVHRDVTPRNVLVDDEGGVRLIDFGIAAPVEPTSGRAREVFGSPGHMPPEQIRGEALGPNADVFAVGALLIEAWTGEPPFRRATAEASFRALRTEPPPLDSSVPELSPLAELVKRSVALDAKERPADAEQFARGLRDFLRGADSVEVGRRLGARVLDVRERLHPSSPVSSAAPANTSPDSTPPLVTPAAGAPVTRTFAARNEMVEWTRKLSSAPPPPGFDTRRLSSPPTTHPQPEVTGSSGFRWALAAGALLLAVSLGVAFSRPSGEAAAGPPPAPKPAVPAAPPERIQAATTAATAELPPPPVAPSAAKPAARAVPSAAPPASSPSPARSAPREPLAQAAAAPAPASVEAADAALRLTADPSAIVSVEGGEFSHTGATPVRALPVRAGSYRVTFRSETYGSPVTTQVTLAPGARRSVHADFRAAVPTVMVR
ncbi:MAG TPA: serine/threonine-protein kinase [Polyangiaceae bacterium]